MSRIEFYDDLKNHLANAQNNCKYSSQDDIYTEKNIRENAENQVRRMRDEDPVSLTLHFVSFTAFLLTSVVFDSLTSISIDKIPRFPCKRDCG